MRLKPLLPRKKIAVVRRHYPRGFRWSNKVTEREVIERGKDPSPPVMRCSPLAEPGRQLYYKGNFRNVLKGPERIKRYENRNVRYAEATMGGASQ